MHTAFLVSLIFSGGLPQGSINIGLKMHSLFLFTSALSYAKNFSFSMWAGLAALVIGQQAVN